MAQRVIGSGSWGWLAAATVCGVLGVPGAPAGGGAENALLIINPQDPDSLYIGNYYKTARGIPDRNVIHLDPGASSYQAFTEFQLDALHGMLANRGISDHIDYVIIPSGTEYRISASGLIADPCFSVSRFAISSVYTMAFISQDVLGGDVVIRRNEYFTSSDAAVAFDSGTGWLRGEPSESVSAKRYFIGALLGYSGNRGNTLQETIAMIDRSVQADGTRPAGTFYFMETTDDARSGPRDGLFPAVVDSLTALGAYAAHLLAVLPTGRGDCLGIMTGAGGPDVSGADLTILPGAFCDHLTSYAAYFGTPSQTKVSEWIAKGASGSWGAVQEPCNYGSKFPRPQMHVYYYQGLSLGEAVLRSVAYVPYQMLLYGDPLTRPFAYIPEVEVMDAPTGTVSGTVALAPWARTGRPDGAISHFDLLIDGVLHSSVGLGDAFTIDTLELADGWHDLRIIAYEDSPVATQGRWISELQVDNLGRSAEVMVMPPYGDLSTQFAVDVSAGGGLVVEIRLMHNGRVLAAVQGDDGSFPIYGRTLGAGPVQLSAVAEFSDGSMAISQPVLIDVEQAGAPLLPGVGDGAMHDGSQPLGRTRHPVSGGGGEETAPVAYSYVADVPVNEPFLLDLPATDADGDELTITVLTEPEQATIESGAGTLLLRPLSDAEGTDTLTFSADDGSWSSAPATVIIRYGAGPCAPAQIVTQPSDGDVCVGEQVTVTVEADGDLPISYQWRKGNVDIQGANSSSLTIESVELEDDGHYRCNVTNACASELSDQAILIVRTPPSPVITVDPGSVVCPGETTILDAGRYSYYLWSTGQTTRSIVVDGIGTYAVTVTDSHGCSGMAEVEISVVPPRIVIDIELQGVRRELTRNVTVVLGSCTVGNETRVKPLSVNESGVGTIELTGMSQDVEWVTVQEGHTLKRRAEVEFDSCGVASVDMTGKRKLLAGDLQTALVPQDNLVDMQDYAILASVWGQLIDPSQNTGGDVNGDGFQNTADFTAILVNNLTPGDEDPPCTSIRSDDRLSVRRGICKRTAARQSIPVDLLSFVDAHRVDLNRDGIVDARDLRAFVDQNGIELTPEQDGKLSVLCGEVSRDRPSG